MSFSTHCIYGGTALCGNVYPFEYTNAFSISCWFKTMYTSTGDLYLVEKSSGFSAYTGYRFFLFGGSGVAGSGALTLSLSNNDSTSNALRVRGATTATDGRWHHGLATYDGSNTPAGIQLYLDGVAEAKTTLVNGLTGSILTTGLLYVGTLGLTDEVALYNRALSPAEATWLYNGKVPRDLRGAGAPPNLLSWWRGGEEGEPYPIVLDSNASAYFPVMPDLSGSEYHGTMTNMAWSNIVADAPGAAGTYTCRSCLFNGTNEYITMGNVLGYERNQTFSISCWFKTTAGGILVAKQANASPSGYVLQVLSGKVRFSLVNTAGSNAIIVETNSTYNDGKWHFCNVTYAGTSLASGALIYIDGSSVSKTTVQDNLTASILNSASFYIGDRQLDQGTTPFNGNIDEVIVHNIAITGSNITTLYNLTFVYGQRVYTPRRPDSGFGGLPAITSMKGWWAMGEGRPGWLTSTTVQCARGNPQGAEATLVSVGGGGGGPAFTYLKRARDLGSGPPAVYTEWTTTDINSSPPTSPPVGPWGEIAVVSKWRI